MLEMAKISVALVKTTDATWSNLSRDEQRLIQAYRQMAELEQRQISRLVGQLANHPRPMK